MHSIRTVGIQWFIPIVIPTISSIAGWAQFYMKTEKTIALGSCLPIFVSDSLGKVDMLLKYVVWQLRLVLNALQVVTL